MNSILAATMFAYAVCAAIAGTWVIQDLRRKHYRWAAFSMLWLCSCMFMLGDAVGVLMKGG